jgi:MFS family permease
MRFLAGMGSAFYFAPGLVIASSVLGQRSGLASGVYFGLFYLGGGVASLAFTPLASSLGWQTPFIVSAVISFVGLDWVFVELDRLDDRQPDDGTHHLLDRRASRLRTPERDGRRPA